MKVGTQVALGLGGIAALLGGYYLYQHILKTRSSYTGITAAPQGVFAPPLIPNTAVSTTPGSGTATGGTFLDSLVKANAAGTQLVCQAMGGPPGSCQALGQVSSAAVNTVVKPAEWVASGVVTGAKAVGSFFKDLF